MNNVDEAVKAMRHATLVLQYIKTNYPDVFQEAMDTVEEQIGADNVPRANKE